MSFKKQEQRNGRYLIPPSIQAWPNADTHRNARLILMPIKYRDYNKKVGIFAASITCKANGIWALSSPNTVQNPIGDVKFTHIRCNPPSE
ncbi:unnamed protein product [Anisakis simplex]|uniref:MSP domain-containing protein n=1 Tax=Anisakis simplex TaxID=6269 RepID=A0A0M3J2I4_ANISI|nr:unnamed protein product [Anisakis simplex]